MRFVNTNSLAAALAAAALATGAAPARADEYLPPAVTVEKPATPALKDPVLLIGVRAGAIFPQIQNKLDSSFLVDLELGYQLPFFHRRFGLFVDGSYTQPTAGGTKTTAQVPDPVDWHLTQRDAGVTLGARYLHFVTPRAGLYLAAGAKAHFTREIVEQKAGSADLGTNTEDSTRIGAVARVGFGYRVGPGMVQLEVNYEWTPVKQLITGDDNTAYLGVQLGYTFFAL